MISAIQTPQSSILESTRWRASARSFRPTAKEGVCDKCGGDVVLRADDEEATVTRRIDVYLSETKPLVEYYEKKGKLVHIDGEEDSQIVQEKIFAALGE